MSDFDLVVIGVGMAGLNAAKKCAARGLSVAVVDERLYGGTCALRGCDPKKMLRRGAEVVEAARLMSGRGVEDCPTIDWAALMAHKRSFTDPVPDKMETGLEKAGVATLHSAARFTGPTTLRVGERTIDAGKVLIATGQRPRTLDVPGGEHLTDSTAFLELEQLPRRILFVGAGHVSMEFAHIAARAGAPPRPGLRRADARRLPARSADHRGRPATRPPPWSPGGPDPRPARAGRRRRAAPMAIPADAAGWPGLRGGGGRPY